MSWTLIPDPNVAQRTRGLLRSYLYPEPTSNPNPNPKLSLYYGIMEFESIKLP